MVTHGTRVTILKSKIARIGALAQRDVGQDFVAAAPDGRVACLRWAEESASLGQQ
jgi:hypothetical protein